ncbi:MAG: AraC family transcriptional regulator [Verrucomicrobia bacterium]|nr:AraC family transcriptional regulator [Verrucomicrobiota bacterium]
MQILPPVKSFQKDYFVYLPANRTFPWGGTVTSTGYARTLPPCRPYPVLRHPVDHHFDWADGRILHAYQMLYISEGTGWFESGKPRRRYRIEPGTLFILFPEIWHRYAPDPEVGWVEHWIECQGRVFDQARSAGIISPKKPVLNLGLNPDVLHCFERCHSWAQRSSPGAQAVLSTLCLQLLAVIEQAQSPRGKEQRQTDEVIQRAQMLLAQRCQENLQMHRLARELNMGYSHFRQVFKKQTGVSPKQYHTQVRLQKAQDFLANTAKPVKEIAEILGFDSASHLSNQFKALTGLAPQPWRRQLNRRANR